MIFLVVVFLPPSLSPKSPTSPQMQHILGVKRVLKHHLYFVSLNSPMVGSTPLHKEQTSSILSSDKIASLPQPGIVNLGAVVLLASNFRLILENMINYGVLFNPLIWAEQFIAGGFQPLMLCWPVLGSCALASLCMEVCGILFSVIPLALISSIDSFLHTGKVYQSSYATG